MESISIKDISGNILLSTPINEGCIRKFTLMKEDYILLKFSLENPVFFKLGSYVECDFGTFEVCDLQRPAFNTSNAGYDYELRLDSHYWKWKNKVFKFTPETGGQEASWNLTATLDVQAGIVLRNLKAIGYTYKGQDFVFSIDNTVENKSQLMTYENINILDALFAMAKKWDCECWVTENVIHFGRCEFGDSAPFEIGVNVEEMSRSESQSTYATRIYAFGSTRNIPANYRPASEQIVVNGIVQKRLMLPEGTPYIDAYPNMTMEESVEQIVVFDEVYPRRTGTMSDVSTKEYTDTIENEDGTTTEQKWNAYRFKDTGITFSKEYILLGEELKIQFQSGKLNGMIFSVIFDPDDKDEQLWEIVRNEEYGRPLPDEVLCPEDGDTYVLSGWDSTKIAELGLVGAAEEELKVKAEKYVEKSKIDPNTYTCKMMSDSAFSEDGLHNLYGIGQKVNLINKAYFDNGRLSRIIGFEFSLDYPYDSPTYTVGETAAYSRIGEIEEKLESITLAGQTYTGEGGSGVYLIRRNDSTSATDSNAFSSLRSLSMFLRKDKADRTPYKVSSDTSFEIGEFVPGSSGAIVYKDNETGQTIGEIDKLHVRMKAYFESLEIVNVNSLGGKQVISPAGSVRLAMAFGSGDKYEIVTAGEGGNDVVKEVTVPQGIYRCFFLAEQDGQEVDNRFKVGNQLQSKDFNVKKPGEYNQVANHYYWRLVTGVSTEPVRIGGLGYHYVDLSVTDCDTGSDVPAKGDVVAQLGDRNDVDYQNALVFSSVDTFSPSITLYQGINSYSLVGKDAVSYGVDKTTGKAFMNVYGEMYIGDRGGNAFVRYTQDNGVEIKGKLAVGTKLGDGKTIEQALNDATQSAIDAANENISSFTNAVTKDIADLQNQIDGAIETWFNDPAPTLTNYPANGWETNEEKNIHLGDLYYSGEGKAYRFQMEGSNYVWKLITDSDITKALADAKKAQDTADGKRTVFVKQPTDADSYQVGDLWVNATYGTTYSNDVLRAVTAKAAGSPFSINHWTKASKYTDDTRAEQVQQNVNNLSTTVNTLSGTVSGMKDFTDTAFADGIVDRSEASAIDKYLNNINTTKADVQNAYSKVYENALLDGVAKTNLANAYSAFSSSATELVTSISNAIADGKTTSAERADVNAKYTNFNAKYGDFVAYLNTANRYIQDKINATANNALTQIGGLAYLKQALREDTTIEGGLIQSSVLALGYTNDGGVYKVMSGTNGIYDSASLGGGIASWWGGAMKDRGNYTESTMPSDVAKALVRMDGSGYLANGGIWWGTDGKIHADPQSFIISENQLGDYLELFQIIYKSGTKDIDYIIPQYVMQKVEVATSVKIGNAYLKYDAASNSIYVEGENGAEAGFWTTGFLSTKGISQGGGTGGGATSLSELSDVLLTSLASDDLLKWSGSKWVNVPMSSIQGASDWADITGKPSWIGSSKPSYSFGELTGKPTTLAGYGVADAVTLNTEQTITGSKTFASYIRLDGFALMFKSPGTTKGLYFEPLDDGSLRISCHDNYSWKTNVGLIDISGNLAMVSFATWGGTSSQFLKADGSVDSNAYITASALDHIDVEAVQDTSWSNIRVTGSTTIKKLRAFDVYGTAAGGPTTYGNVLEIAGIYQHWQPQLWFDAYPGGSLRHRNKSYDSNNWGAWHTILDTNNYSSFIDSRYVKKTGDTMTGALSIGNVSSSSAPLQLDVTASMPEVGIRLNMNGVSKGWLGYHPTYGTNLYNYSCTKYLGITDAGVPNLSGSTIWHAGNDGSGSGLDADLLDGVHASHILERAYVGNSYSQTSTGWFRIAESFSSDAVGIYGMLLLRREYNYANNESYVFSINVTYNQAASITQISGHANNRLIDKIRVTGNTNSGVFYIDIHIATSTTNNGYCWTTIGGFKSLGSWRISPSAGKVVTEFTTVNGCKSNEGFTGSFSGNASSATKLQTARTLWGQTFDGTGNVDGHLTINNSNLTTVNYGVTSSFGALNSSYCHFQTTASLFHFNKGISVQNNVESYGSGSVGTASKPWNGMYSSNWFRSTGATGWYSETYGGGIHMDNSSWVKAYNRPFYSSAVHAIGSHSYNVNLKLEHASHASIEVTGGNYTMGLGCHSNGLWHWWRGTDNPSSDSNKEYVMQYDGTTWNFTGVLYASSGIWTNGYVSAKGQNQSDARLKTDIKNFNATSIIKSLRPVSFKWNELARKNSKAFDTDEVQYGLIAQEVKVVAPWAAVDNMFKDGYMGVRYEKFIPVLMKAQIETIDEVADLKRRLSAVERENERLRKEIQMLKVA